MDAAGYAPNLRTRGETLVSLPWVLNLAEAAELLDCLSKGDRRGLRFIELTSKSTRADVSDQVRWHVWRWSNRSDIRDGEIRKGDSTWSVREPGPEVRARAPLRSPSEVAIHASKATGRPRLYVPVRGEAEVEAMSCAWPTIRACCQTELGPRRGSATAGSS